MFRGRLGLFSVGAAKISETRSASAGSEGVTKLLHCFSDGLWGSLIVCFSPMNMQPAVHGTGGCMHMRVKISMFVTVHATRLLDKFNTGQLQNVRLTLWAKCVKRMVKLISFFSICVSECKLVSTDEMKILQDDESVRVNVCVWELWQRCACLRLIAG